MFERRQVEVVYTSRSEYVLYSGAICAYCIVNKAPTITDPPRWREKTRRRKTLARVFLLYLNALEKYFEVISGVEAFNALQACHLSCTSLKRNKSLFRTRQEKELYVVGV